MTDLGKMDSAPVSTELLSIVALKLPEWDVHADPLNWYKQNAATAPQMKNLLKAAEYLSSGDRTVAFPTETVYGLGADATRSESVQKIYWAKKRPSDNPLIVHIASLNQLSHIRKFLPLPPVYEALIENFWPGPLTILLPLPEPSPFAPEIHQGHNTFGVRMPRTSVARLLIALAQTPIAAPSANTSKRPSTTTADHVWEDLHGRVDIILDGGPCGLGVESTVVDGLSNPPAILRPGGISIDQIRMLGGHWANTVIGYPDGMNGMANGSNDAAAPRAPGMKYKHYAPRGHVILYDASTSQVHIVDEMAEITYGIGKINGPGVSDGPVGFLRTSESYEVFLGCLAERKYEAEIALIFSSAMLASVSFHKLKPRDMYTITLGPTVEEIARDLFAALRAFDAFGCTLILVEGITGDGLATAVMNRLRKAASG